MVHAIADMGRQFDRIISPVLMAQSIGRQLISKNMMLSGRGIGNTSISSFGYKDTAEAVTEYQILQSFADRPDIESSKVLIPIQQDMATIKRRDFEAMRMQGYSVDADVSIQMAKKVSWELDKTIIQGWNNGEVKGFFQVAALSHTGYDFGTYKGAIQTVSEGLKQLHENKIYSQGYNLVVHPEQYRALLISETPVGIEELPKVLNLLNENAPGQFGRVYSCEHLEPGTGFMTPVATPANQLYCDLIEAQEPKHYLSYTGGINEAIADINLQLVGAAVPRFKYLDENSLSPAVIKFTALSG